MNRPLNAALALGLWTLSGTAFAHGEPVTVEALLHQIEALQKRVEQLEARHTFASFMPNVAERFHVMHRAGEAGDWAVAAHELAEIQRITRLATASDLEQGKLMQSMMAPSYAALEGAIEHGNAQKFAAALEQTINSCNACHTATGSDFVEVTLNAREAISLRHPHRLDERDAPAGHTHGPSAGMEQMHGAQESHAHPEGTPAHQD